MAKMHNTGWLEIIVGPMFSGKSTELISRATRAELGGQKVIAFKPSKDTRGTKGYIEDRSGGKTEATRITTPTEVLKLIEIDNNTPDVLIIDEVQFMSQEILKVIDVLISKKIRVIVSGLDQDFRGETFSFMGELLAKADFVTKISAVCRRCGNPATKTQRLIGGKPANYNEPTVVVGDKESYEARCRGCHKISK